MGSNSGVGRSYDQIRSATTVLPAPAPPVVVVVVDESAAAQYVAAPFHSQ